LHITHIRTKLVIAFLVIALVPLILSALLNMTMTYHVLTDHSKQALMGAATQTAGEIDAFIQDNLNTVRTQSLLPDIAYYLEMTPILRHGSIQEANAIQILDSFRRKDQINISSYAIFNRAGERLLDTYGLKVLDSHEPTYLKESLKTGLPFVSPFLFSRESGVGSLYFSSPIRDAGGEIIGFLRARYNANAIQKLIYEKEGLLGSGSCAILLDENMIRIADSHERDMISKPLTSLSSPQMKQLISEGRYIIPVEDRESLPDFQVKLNAIDESPYFSSMLYPSSGQLMLCAAVRLKTRPWVVVFAQSEDVFLASLEKQLLYAALLLVGIAILASAVALITARTQARPLIQLNSMAGMIARGDLNQRIARTTQDETGQLAETFNQMAQALQTSNQELVSYTSRLEVLLDTVPDAVFVHGQDGRIIDVNSRCSELYGYTRHDLLEMTAGDISGKEYSPHMVEDMMARALKSGHIDFEWTGRKKDGSEFPLLARLRRVTLGDETNIMAVVTDITDRRLAEEALKESERRFRALAEYSVDAIMRFDRQHRHLYVNPVVQNQTGIKPEFFIGKTHRELGFPEDLCTIWTDVLDKVFETGEVQRIEFQLPTHIWIDWLLAPETDDHGQVVAVVTSGREITDRKKAEEERTRLEAQLAQAHKMESIGTLAGGIAHDFNNLLSAIFGYTELAIDDASNPNNVRAHLKEVLKSSERARDLVKQILAFSRKTETAYTPIVLRTVIHESLMMLRSVIPTTVEIQQDLADTGLIMSDPTQINQIMMNLCTNAVHAMDERGGMLTVALKKVELRPDDAPVRDLAAGPYMKLSVSDTGRGMPPEVIERIFDPYFTTKEIGRGTGLGLSVVHGIVRSHGGAVVCNSKPGEGTTFDVYLPEIKSARSGPEIMEAKVIAPGNERILFVDDEPALVKLAESMLSKLGYTVTTRTQPAEAYDLFRLDPESFDLVITDMTMPGLRGDMLARKLLEVRPDTPIILCTGYNEHISEEKAKDIGIRAYMLKPLEMKELSKTIRKVLGKGVSGLN